MSTRAHEPLEDLDHEARIPAAAQGGSLLPVLWVQGHLYHSVDNEVGTCRVVSNPRGYYDSATRSTDNGKFQPGFIVTV